MTEENKPKISDMLRQTAANSSDLMIRIADRIDWLEAKVAAQSAKLAELGVVEDGSND